MLYAAQLFTAVHCPGGRQIFGVQFSLLLDTLQVTLVPFDILSNHPASVASELAVI